MEFNIVFLNVQIIICLASRYFVCFIQFSYVAFQTKHSIKNNEELFARNLLMR